MAGSGGEVALLVPYRSRARATVTAELGGCATVRRSPAVRWAVPGPAVPALLAELVRLTP
ncbi:MAG TPA: hypothetical protein VHW26_06415 [Solirubrobacteraceae bacterium]|nr:hypothetical protein [Solirubrobacteraceae bacterium]